MVNELMTILIVNMKIVTCTRNAAGENVKHKINVATADKLNLEQLYIYFTRPHSEHEVRVLPLCGGQILGTLPVITDTSLNLEEAQLPLILHTSQYGS